MPCRGEKRRNAMRVLLQKPEGKIYLEEPDVAGRILLKCTLNKLYGMPWTGFIWLRLGPSGRFL